ncbi:ribokinase [Leifsonia poae]|uniref:ribokinase n=1 Tax=Leifsonia poae TaxID=110933 RepID=UPI003D66C73F
MNERLAPADPEVDLLVVGSVNEDHFTFVQTFPRPGETVTAIAARRGLGGKGANQAVAAARAGAIVRFAAKVGADGAGASAIEALRAAGVITDAIDEESGCATGSASIAVDASGENWVIVDAGANSRLAWSDADRIFDAYGAPSVILTQGETPAATVAHVARRAHDAGSRFVLNLAPVIDIPNEALQISDPLIVNEHEAAAVATALGLSADSPSELATALTSVARSVVITLGAAGAVSASDEGVWNVAGLPADGVVDTTGAGDAFVGSLCARLAVGDDLRAAMTWASAAASLSVGRPGAAESYATSDEVERRLLLAGVSA